MATPSIADLYRAYRQAKIALFFERRGVGRYALARFEDRLSRNLLALQQKLRTNGGWFGELAMGDLWVVPKRLRRGAQGDDQVIRIGSPSPSEGLDVQLRCTPTPEFAIVEVLYLWRFGPLLEQRLLPSVVGYRLDLKDGQLRPNSRWLFQYWPRRYQEFRSEPLRVAENALRRGESVLILSADFASFYDTVDPSFMVDDTFVAELECDTADDEASYRSATLSWLECVKQYRRNAERLTGASWKVGIPIGPITSRVVANLALAPLDAAIVANPRVLCYRRYVDDLVIVGRSDANNESGSLDDAVAGFVPAVSSDNATFVIDAAQLGRGRSEFALQRKKIRAHQLSDVQGQSFVRAVRNDIGKTVSESRAFLDPAVFVDNALRYLVRTTKEGGSPLRVLREADRAKLERFALSTSLGSLERISGLVNLSEAQALVRRALDEVLRVLDSEDNWVENLELVFRLLRLSVATNDASSCTALLTRMNAMWGDVAALQTQVGALFHRGRRLSTGRVWVWLRNYLHERRAEDVAVALRPDVESDGAWLKPGVAYRTSTIGRRALLNQAKRLAASDLRMRDREDDRFGVGAFGDTEAWDVATIREDSDLGPRMLVVAEFVQGLSNSSAWRMPPARLFLCTRPPSYFDIARRILATAGKVGFGPDVFGKLLGAVNAIRGTAYRDPVGKVVNPATVEIPRDPPVVSDEDGAPLDPRLILANLVAREDPEWKGAATFMPGSSVGRPVLSLDRLRRVASVLKQADRAARRRAAGDRPSPPSLLVMPELGLPRSWFRAVATYVVRGGKYGLVVGLEYKHLPNDIVENQVHAVLPGPYRSAATWSWIKEFPSREEGRSLAEQPVPLYFAASGGRQGRTRRIVVRSSYGEFSVLVCSELLETARLSELLGRVELVLVPSWNSDTASYDHLVQSVGLHLNVIVAVANNGKYSDCRAWAPLVTRWERDLCRLIERDVDSVVTVDIPLASLRAFRADPRPRLSVPKTSGWRPLPPEWP